MSTLADTSILCRLANLIDANHAAARAAIGKLHRRGEVVYITPQNLIEFRNVATRSVKDNGLGRTPAEASQLTATFVASFPLLEETADIFPAWRAIVDGLGIIGKTVHDARLVAVCHVQGVSQVLTFNVNHFSTLAKFGSGVIVLDPRTV